MGAGGAVVAILGAAVVAFVIGARAAGKAAHRMADDIEQAGGFSAATFAKLNNDLKLFSLSMQRGARFGRDLAALENLRGRRERAGIRIQDNFTRAFMPLVIKMSESLTAILEILEPLLKVLADDVVAPIVNVLTEILTIITNVYNWLVDNTFIGNILKRIEGNTRKDLEQGDLGKALADMLAKAFHLYDPKNKPNHIKFQDYSNLFAHLAGGAGL
jgi:hypothetical protein